jgi:NADH dehydrogenase
VVVVGAGFAGLSATRTLAKLPVDVLLLDRHNYHLFTPLLYQVATAGLEPEEIAQPVRTILRGWPNARFRMTSVTGLDLEERTVHTDTGSVGYDYLVLATGSETNFFGNAGIERAALGLKGVDDALALRSHILSRFEAAVSEQDPVRRAALLTFVVVGGGPTGVEFAGALSELAAHTVAHDFPELEAGAVRIVLLEAAGELLAGMAPRLQRSALRALQRKHVDVRLHTAVEQIDAEAVHLRGGGRIGAGTVVWAAGVRASDLATKVPAPHGRAGRLVVLPTLQLADHPEIFVAGDMAAARERGDLLPMVAPAAMQEGTWAARNIGRRLAGQEPRPFHYRNRGMMATIGRNAAVAQIGPLRFSGFLAWVLWLTLHLVWLVGFRNRVLVFINWIWNYVTYERAVRLILEAPTSPPSSSLSRGA